jgi:A1 cistron-splicing factor AAR2
LQIREVPEDFFVDIVSSNNFLVSLLTSLFTLTRDNSDIDSKLKTRIEQFKTSLSLKFQWDFSEIDDGEEPEEDQPVVIQI